MSERRLFLALMPDPPVRDALKKAAVVLHKRCGGRRTRDDMLHLTLVFIGATQEADTARLIDALSTFAFSPFQLNLSRFGSWQPGIGWLAPTGEHEALNELVTSLRTLLKSFDIAFDTKRFCAHVTLLRRGTRPAQLPDDIAIDWAVDRLALVESEPDARGARYRVIATCDAKV